MAVHLHSKDPSALVVVHSTDLPVFVIQACQQSRQHFALITFLVKGTDRKIKPDTGPLGFFGFVFRPFVVFSFVFFPPVIGMSSSLLPFDLDLPPSPSPSSLVSLSCLSFPFALAFPFGFPFGPAFPFGDPFPFALAFPFALGFGLGLGDSETWAGSADSGSTAGGPSEPSDLPSTFCCLTGSGFGFGLRKAEGRFRGAAGGFWASSVVQKTLTDSDLWSVLFCYVNNKHES